MRRTFNQMSSQPYTAPHTPTTQPPYNTNFVFLPAPAHPFVVYPNSPYNYYYYYVNGNDPSQFNRKRQRRQAAGVAVESLWGNSNSMGRKSTAQPRPVLNVPPRGIGPIVDPNENDVLCGRGGRINSHPGNVKFRDIINSKKKDYLAPSTKKLEKAHIAAAIVNGIRSLEPAGRFLKEDRDTGLWFDIGDAKAIKKTGQALREDAPDIRHEIEGDSSGDEKPKGDTSKGVKAVDKAQKQGEKAKSPPKQKSSPKNRTTSSNHGLGGTQGAQHAGGQWQQGNEHPLVVSAQDYQAQIAMPPPYSQQANPYMQQQLPRHSQPEQGFATRTIPIQSPMPPAIYSLPNQLVTGARTGAGRASNTSRHATDALSQAGGRLFERQGQTMVPEDVAFGRAFHPPADSVLSGGNTVSTISGLSEQVSSMVGGSALNSDFGRGSAISGLSGLSGLSGMDTSGRSARSSGRAGYRDPTLRFNQFGFGQPNRRDFTTEAMKSSKMSDVAGSVRSLGSLSRSLSFNDMNSIVGDEPWKAIMEDEPMFHEGAPPEASLLSGEEVGAVRPQYQDSSAMSITSMSTSSSARWMARVNDNNMLDDNRSVFSAMSAELHALDLAHPGGPHGL